MADKRYDDRALAEANDKALPKPQIQIIVDGKSICFCRKAVTTRRSRRRSDAWPCSQTMRAAY